MIPSFSGISDIGEKKQTVTIMVQVLVAWFDKGLNVTVTQDQDTSQKVGDTSRHDMT